jgi:peptidyl-prolyl cis-trans isomerase B (cyclophilin B)
MSQPAAGPPPYQPQQPGQPPYATPPYPPPPGAAAQQPYVPQPFPPAPPYQQPNVPSGPYGYPPPVGTNGMAIASIILAFFFSPAGIVCGLVALNQIKQRPQPGRNLAIAGTLLSVAMLIAGTVYYIVNK